MATEWTDDERAQVVKQYGEADPTPETSMDIVKDLAEQIDKTPNGVRMILTKAGVYVKKTPAKGEKKASGSTTRISKEDALQTLREAILAAGQEVDEDVVKRLTGKAAQYFTKVISPTNG